MTITTADLRNLKQSLPPNWSEILAKRNKCSTSTIYKVLSGLRNSDAILADAYKLAMETKEENERVQQGIKGLRKNHDN